MRSFVMKPSQKITMLKLFFALNFSKTFLLISVFSKHSWTCFLIFPFESAFTVSAVSAKLVFPSTIKYRVNFSRIVHFPLFTPTYSICNKFSRNGHFILLTLGFIFCNIVNHLVTRPLNDFLSFFYMLCACLMLQSSNI